MNQGMQSFRKLAWVLIAIMIYLAASTSPSWGADTTSEALSRIDATLVETCALFPLAPSQQLGFLYRTFDNGTVQPILHQGRTVGLQVLLRPGSLVASNGVPRPITRELAANDKFGYLTEEALNAFEPAASHFVYTLNAP